ncbi:MAG: lytic transglycosylase domain-containing protein [Myxococcales bacterium]|nr:lytic transglycosylase domain-containing protein [Myxococcales bacterium]
MADPEVVLASFSESERQRILAVQGIVDAAAGERAIDPSLLNAIIWVESRFDPQAKSSAGARGLMQLMPATAAYLAKRMGERSARAYDPEFNVRAGALYLSEMISKFGDEQYAVAAYHAGPGNVKRWLEHGEDFPDYSQDYVAKVMAARERFRGLDAVDKTHGRSSEERSVPVIVEPKAEPRTLGHEPGVEPEPPPEMIAPDPDTLPDAAEIHGMARVLDDDPYADYEDEESDEPVFVPHPELDKDPPAPEPAPEPAPKPKPAPIEPEPAGLGLLPDL